MLYHQQEREEFELPVPDLYELMRDLPMVSTPAEMTPIPQVDHCTWWPEGTWAKCCEVHDQMYANPAISRWLADKELAQCVWQATDGDWFITGLMLLGLGCAGWVFRLYARAKGKHT